MENEKIEQGAKPEASSPAQEAEALIQQRNRIRELESKVTDLERANTKFVNAMLNENPVKAEVVPPKRSAKEIREDLLKAKDNTNLAYAKLCVEMDDACIREQGESCFLPKGTGVRPTMEEKETAQRFRQALDECIEAAEGDDQRFQLEFIRRLQDDSPINSKR